MSKNSRKSEPLHVEVRPMTPMRNNKPGSLSSIKDQINTEYAAYLKIEQEAAMRAVKIGLLLIAQKKQLPHGDFMSWCEQNTSIKDRQINRFMRLADFFLHHAKLPQKDVLLLTDGDGGLEPSGKIEQLLLDFVGDQSQADLFNKYGVTGGKREVNGKRRTMQAIDREEAQVIWGQERLAEIANHGVEKKTWRWLERAELETAFEVFRQTTEAMKAELKIRHKIT